MGKGLPTAKEWQEAFQIELQAGGAFEHVQEVFVSPLQVAQEVQRARAAEKELEQKVNILQKRVTTSIAEAALRTQDDIIIRKELQAARSAAEPSVLQLRQLLLDPAVNREFTRLKSELETKTKDLVNAQMELQKYHMMVQDPKAIHAMTMQITSLQDQCDALKREMSESRVSQLERSLAGARNQLEELRRQYGQLEDHAHSLDDEVELLNKELMSMRRSVEFKAEKMSNIAAGGGGGDVKQQAPGPSGGFHHPSATAGVVGPSSGGGGGGGSYYDNRPPPIESGGRGGFYGGRGGGGRAGGRGPPFPGRGGGGPYYSGDGGRGRGFYGGGEGPPHPGKFYGGGRGGGPPPHLKRPREY